MPLKSSIRSYEHPLQSRREIHRRRRTHGVARQGALRRTRKARQDGTHGARMGRPAAHVVRDQAPYAEPSGALPRRVRTQRHGQRHGGALGRRRRRDERHGVASGAGARRAEPHQEQVDALRGVRAYALPARAGRRCRRERPGRADHAVAGAAAQPHRAARYRRTP